ncbi:MAG: acyl-CoA thioesterase [Gemmatimonadetes bacterium]|nr:acyl-CoA thioesterase [Gemmatimonadota bacterium]MBT8479749.1 acyl-CoA thioesterase [Gemmatimonadota bacterium]
MSLASGAFEPTRLRVRYAETDQMGRAHHMHYLAWFELGRTDLLRAAGVAYSKIEQEGVKLPVSHVEIEYRGPVRYDELVDVYTRVSGVRSRTVTFTYLAVRAETGDELAAGSTRLVCTDDKGKPRRIPPHLIDVLESLKANAHAWPES